MQRQGILHSWPWLHFIILTLALFDLLKGQHSLVMGQGRLGVGADDDNGALLHCGPGQRLVTPKEDQLEECQPCPASTYMSSRRHRNPECLPCKRRKSRREMVVIPCTNVTNTVMGCAPGYYKRPIGTLTKDFTCMNCRNCSIDTPPQFVGRPCQGEDNTFCCEQPGMEVVGGTCSYSPNTVTVCALGFYDSKPSPSEKTTEPTCRPCTVCSFLKNGAIYEARPCGRSMDTVCCSRPNANTFFNFQTGRYQCHHPADEPESHPGHQPTKSHNTGAGRGHATGTLTSSKAPCVNPQSDTSNTATVFFALFLIFFVISIVLLSILGLQAFRRRRRRRTSTPNMTYVQRRRRSLVENDALELSRRDASEDSEC